MSAQGPDRPIGGKGAFAFLLPRPAAPPEDAPAAEIPPFERRKLPPDPILKAFRCLPPPIVPPVFEQLAQPPPPVSPKKEKFHRQLKARFTRPVVKKSYDHVSDGQGGIYRARQDRLAVEGNDQKSSSGVRQPKQEWVPVKAKGEKTNGNGDGKNGGMISVDRRNFGVERFAKPPQENRNRNNERDGNINKGNNNGDGENAMINEQHRNVIVQRFAKLPKENGNRINEQRRHVYVKKSVKMLEKDVTGSEQHSSDDVADCVEMLPRAGNRNNKSNGKLIEQSVSASVEKTVEVQLTGGSVMANGKELRRRIIAPNKCHTETDSVSQSSNVVEVSGTIDTNEQMNAERLQNLEALTSAFLALYESCKPREDENNMSQQILLSLSKVVEREWPTAKLHLFGSSVNSFGFLRSDVDICMAVDAITENDDKKEIVSKLADVLSSENYIHVEALTSARVPIVRLQTAETGISCDICINNLFGITNSKLLKDYAQIDERLLQLAFIVKHWAKSRAINETYKGFLSSYAYVLMCINFLQLREPKILPCLQAMDSTYSSTVGDTKCEYFDRVHELNSFGTGNTESIGQLALSFFQHWAFSHDYRNSVVSIRTGGILSKSEKNWTTRNGQDRHLISIEDPFETWHDLGRSVDKFTIKILRQEFVRAAYILENHTDPLAVLFQSDAP